MRGAERPANVRWTRPFLETLKPLGQDAARQMFIDITDDIHRTEDIDKILLLVDNMPLAIDLIANLVDSEGMSSVLSRWETQRTSIFSDGYDTTSNLGLSILLSLSGPRMISSPHALDLLSLLSILPNGLSDVELLQSKFPLENILSCKSTLLRTALAYTNGQKRLKVLAPVREYVEKNHPPKLSVIHPLSEHYKELLALHQKYHGTLSYSGVMGRVASNFSNIQNVLLQCLSSDRSNLPEIIRSSCELISYSRLAGHGHLSLMDRIPGFLQSTDHKLEVYFIIQTLEGWNYWSIPNAKELIDRALEHFKHFHDPDMQCELSLDISLSSPADTALGQFYNVVAHYHSRVRRDHCAAIQFCQASLALAISTGSLDRQSNTLQQLAFIKTNSGDYSGATKDASESQRVAKIAGNLYIEARALRVEVICCNIFGSYSRCISLLERAIHLLDLCGLSASALHYDIRTGLADVHRCKSEYAEARIIQIHILRDVSADQNPYQHGFALLNMSQIDVEIGASEDDVKRNLATAVTLFRRMNYSDGIMFCDILKAVLALQQGDFSAARRLFQSCLSSAWGQDTDATAYCLEKLGTFYQWGPTDQESFPWTVTFLAYSYKSKQRLELHKALQFLGDVFRAQGDQETAVSLFLVALDGFTQMDVHRSRGECMVQLGNISKGTGDVHKAVELWETAKQLLDRSSQRKQLAELDLKLASLSDNQQDESTLLSFRNTHTD
jgi:tetratricopeptide (TPR) repeat protein